MFIQSEKNTAASRTMTVPTAITIFWTMLLAVDLVKPKACGKRLISEFINTTSDVSIATSVPPPMAIPISAIASDGLSLTPSPTKATISPFARSEERRVGKEERSLSSEKDERKKKKKTAQSVVRKELIMKERHS